MTCSHLVTSRPSFPATSTSRWRRLAVMSALVASACSQSPEDAAFTAHMKAIARAPGSSEGRAQAVLGRLDTMGLPGRRVPFERPPAVGVNVDVELPGGAGPALLLGAHHDRVSRGQGAVDNASGCAAVLDLLDRFAARPLANHRVRAVFLDLEEKGMLGSWAYAEGLAPDQRPDLFLNFDIFAFGDTAWIAGALGADKLIDAATTVGAKRSFAVRRAEHYPPSDHASFRRELIPAASVSLVPSEQVAALEDFAAGPRIDHFPRTPPLIALIHTEADVIEAVDPLAALSALDVIEEALRRWDAGL
jgi:aminopeptidase S